MAADSRDALIRSGIELLAAQRWQELQGVVATRAITERAGVTTGSFFHHFRNRAHYSEALADRFVELWTGNVERLVGDIEQLLAGDVEPSVMRTVADADWEATERDVAMATLQVLLWVARDQPLTEDTDRTAGAVLADAYRTLTDRLLPRYEEVLARLGREVLPPFQVEDVAVFLTAMAEGMAMRGAVDGAALRDGIYADLIAALVIALTRPVGEIAESVELSSLEWQLRAASPDGRTGPGEGSTWRHIADAAEPLFVDRAIAGMKVAEIAAAAGVSTSTVYHQFGTVAAVAAATWARHIPELEAISVNPLTAAEGPIVRLEQVLTRFVELGRANRGALEGLVRVAVENAGPSAEHDPRGGRRWTPVWALLVPHVRELRTRGLLRRRIDADRLARSMIQLSSIRTLLAFDEPVERIIDETLGLLLEGALARTDAR